MASVIGVARDGVIPLRRGVSSSRSEEHTSELQSRFDLVCRLLLENRTQYDSGTSSIGLFAAAIPPGGAGFRTACDARRYLALSATRSMHITVFSRMFAIYGDEGRQ